jgi:hypothetical protein
MQPFKCPCCNGTGKVSRPPWIPGDQECWLSTGSGELYDCQACAGTGVLWGPYNYLGGACSQCGRDPGGLTINGMCQECWAERGGTGYHFGSTSFYGVSR